MMSNLALVSVHLIGFGRRLSSSTSPRRSSASSSGCGTRSTTQPMGSSGPRPPFGQTTHQAQHQAVHARQTLRSPAWAPRGRASSLRRQPGRPSHSPCGCRRRWLSYLRRTPEGQRARRTIFLSWKAASSRLSASSTACPSSIARGASAPSCPGFQPSCPNAFLAITRWQPPPRCIDLHGIPLGRVCDQKVLDQLAHAIHQDRFPLLFPGGPT